MNYLQGSRQLAMVHTPCRKPWTRTTSLLFTHSRHPFDGIFCIAYAKNRGTTGCGFQKTTIPERLGTTGCGFQKTIIHERFGSTGCGFQKIIILERLLDNTEWSGKLQRNNRIWKSLLHHSKRINKTEHKVHPLMILQFGAYLIRAPSVISETGWSIFFK